VFGNYVHSCLFLQGSAAAELWSGGKFESVVYSAERIVKLGQ